MKKTILKICFKPLTWINKIIKKDERRIFFYTNLGFRDNVKAFYDYLIEEQYNKNFKIIVSANDYEDYNNNVPENVTFVSNKKGIGSFIKAKYAFYCFGKYPIKPSKQQVVVNLWHGTPLKKIGNLEKGCENIDYNFFSKVITGAEMYKPIMAAIFNCDESDVEVLGNPRNDEMFKRDSVADSTIREEFDKVIVWLPTYREYDEGFVVSTLNREQMEDLNELLKENNAQLIIKLHPLQKADIKAFRYTNIRFITQSELGGDRFTVYTLLRNADGLITDYSSVYFDYMLLDRPIAFATSDIEKYKQNRGFVFDNPKDYMPGMEIETAEDVKKFVEDVVNGVDEYSKQRSEINDRVNYYKDGESCKRIAERFIKA